MAERTYSEGKMCLVWKFSEELIFEGQKLAENRNITKENSLWNVSPPPPNDSITFESRFEKNYN